MKEERRIRGEPEASATTSAATPDARQARGSIQDHLRKTQQVIQGLRKDLDYYRTQSQELVRDRDELSELRGRLQSREGQLADLESEVRFLRRQRDELADAFESLKNENEQISERCAWLQAARDEERTRHQEAQQVIVCLEAQLHELQSLVDLLQEHEEFLADETEG